MKQSRAGLRAETTRLDPTAMPRLHDGMELVYVHLGSIPLAFPHGHLVLSEGQLALTWAAIPRVVSENHLALCTLVQIPLDRFLAWRLPEALTQKLLSGEPLRGLAGDIEEIAVLKWEDDLLSDDHWVRHAAELEIQACVLRMARKEAVLEPMGSEPVIWRQMVAFVLAHLEEDLPVARVAAAVGRHPSRAMSLFHQQTGFTLGSFILRHRLARSKRLLIDSRLSVGEVAMRSGFGSERRFFEVFRKLAGQTPGAYRRQMRQQERHDV